MHWWHLAEAGGYELAKSAVRDTNSKLAVSDSPESQSWVLLGDTKERLRLGIAYANGQNVPLDVVYSIYWFEPLANAGNLDAQYQLGYVNCAVEGFQDNCASGIEWWSKAAEHYHVLSQIMLGLSYEQGYGVLKNMKVAAYWYTKAANTGEGSSARQLGRLFALGEGVPKDLVQSHMWFNLSASTGNEEAKKARDALEKIMTSVQIAEAERYAREWRPKSESAHDANSPSDASARENKNEPQFSGTGFIVSRVGHILTNHHVIEGCTRLRIAQSKIAVNVLSSDKNNDLAILKSEIQSDKFAVFREGRGVRAGDDVVAFGFPLNGILSTSGNVAVGVVSALTGMNNDSSRIQISAPVQPGNSGGPLLDRNGNVVGVIVSKLNAIKMAQANGDIPQNVNFAVSEPVARGFLDANDVPYETATLVKSLETSEIADQARKYTVLIECWK